MKMGLKRSSQAVSEVLGTVLLIAIAVALFSVIYSMILFAPTVELNQKPLIVGELRQNRIILEHQGGESILFTDSTIVIDAAEQTYISRTNDDINDNGRWDIGERIIFEYDSLDHYEIEVKIVDTKHNTLLLSGILQQGQTVTLQTQVHQFTSYIVNSTQLTINATNTTEVDSISLWYQYSFDNASWFNYTLYQSDSNGTDGWNWEFSFPINCGYYQFYSIGQKSDTIEQPPSYPDTYCFYNSPFTTNTTINPITPYEQTQAPLSLMVTGDRCSLDNVTLWYRYSSDNSSWWNSSWLKRKTINLNISSESTPSNYQVLLNITYDNDVNTNFSDLRFVNYSDNSTELNYWIESKSDGNWALVWVEIGNSITTVNQTLAWMYYSNLGASSTSNGTNTFLFFDDFSEGLNKWTIDPENSDTVSISQNQGNSAPALRHDPDSSQTKNMYYDTRLRTTDYKILDGTIEYDVYLAGTQRIIHQFGWRANSLSWTNGYCWRLQNSAADGGFFEFFNPATWTQIGTAFPVVSTGTWYHVKINVSGADYSAKITPSVPSGDSTCSITDSTKTTAEYLVSHVHGVSMTSENYVLLDNVFVRKYHTTTPTVSIGNEQGWIRFGTDITSVDGWNWEFNFPNGTGYYNFYSIGKYNGEPEETPENADAICKYYEENQLAGRQAQWHLNEGIGPVIYDDIGNYNGTIHGAAWTIGVNGSALNCNGVSDYVEINNSRNFPLNNTVSFEAWVCTQEQKTAKIIQKGDWDGHGLGLDVWDGWNGGIYINGDRKYSLYWGNGQPELNQWYHLVLTYDGATIRLYVNGTEMDNGSVSGTLRVNSRSMFMGSDAGAQKFFHGSIDEVAIYDRPLTPFEVESRYNMYRQ